MHVLLRVVNLSHVCPRSNGSWIPKIVFYCPFYFKSLFKEPRDREISKDRAVGPRACSWSLRGIRETQASCCLNALTTSTMEMARRSKMSHKKRGARERKKKSAFSLLSTGKKEGHELGVEESGRRGKNMKRTSTENKTVSRTGANLGQALREQKSSSLGFS